MKALVLAEKPSVGKELARVLGCKEVNKSFCEGKDYIVTWAMGHLVELADPEEYNNVWKNWQLEYLPMLPEKMKHKVIGRTSQQFNAIKKLFARNDVNNLIIATDAGREGELVARWIMRLGGWKGNTQRLWISSQTDQAIKDGFKALKNGSSYDNLFYAAECRAEADWIIGLNVTRALSCKYDTKLSAGRVQTPTLSIIIERENEIKSFKPEPFWTINIDFGNFTAMWFGKNGINRFKDYENAKKIVDNLKDKEGIVSELITEDKSEMPPLAYDLTALQRDANKILNFSAKKTLQTLQQLYERHKIATYPRTDSRYITSDIVTTLKDRLKAIENTKYGVIVKNLLKEPIVTTKRLVDDSKVSDHHAIIPTEEKVVIERLNPDEKALWDLIAKRFLVVLSKPYRYKKNTVIVDVNGEKFKAVGIETVDQGWKSIAGNDFSENDENEELPIQSISKLKKDDKLSIKKINTPQQFTKPPARYTEGTLLAAMENPVKFVETTELKNSIQKGGLGTPATRADIIEKLFDNYYIERNGKEILPTGKGFELIELVPKDLCSPELTAKWELRLSKIASGEEKSFLFSKDIRENAKELVNLVKASIQEYKPKNESNVQCPVCGKKLLNVKDDKSRKLLVCRSRSCGYEQKEHEKTDDLTRRPSKKE
ncbi:MAG TPA: DNA topoisomerase III, partial [Spirochaetota bacterium]|nr:DNA topoisomerase III [Spirochaetota bacterium]